jgi:hypothetical protein
MKAKFEDLVKVYRDEKYFTTNVCGLRRELPIRKVDKEMWIASMREFYMRERWKKV